MLCLIGIHLVKLTQQNIIKCLKPFYSLSLSSIIFFLRSVLLSLSLLLACLLRGVFLPSFLPLGTSPQADPGQGPPVPLCLVEQGFGVNGWVCNLR